MIKFLWLKANTYNYLTDKGSGDKTAKDTKKCIIKIKLTFEN